MRTGVLAGVAVWMLFLGVGQASAQVYELIKTCKRTWRMALVCIVIEKGVEKTVEKSVENWLADWRSGKGQNAPAPALKPAAPGVDYRMLMRDLDAKLGNAPLKDKTLVEALGRSCLGTSSIACNEFRPSFKTAAPPKCASIMTSLRCNLEPGCVWHGAPSSTKSLTQPSGTCAPKS